MWVTSDSSADVVLCAAACCTFNEKDSSTAHSSSLESVVIRSKSWSMTALGGLSCRRGLSSSRGGLCAVIPKPVGSGVLGPASSTHYLLFSFCSTSSYSSCYFSCLCLHCRSCIAIRSSTSSSTLSNSCGTFVPIALTSSSSSSSWHSPSPTSVDFRLSSLTWRLSASCQAITPPAHGVGCERGLDVVELGLEVTERG